MFQSSKYLDVNPKLFVAGEINYSNLTDLYEIISDERFSKQPLFQVSLRDFAFEDSENNFKTNHEYRIRNLIKQWEKSKVISKPTGKGWQKHSFSELIWFRLIMKFREFGYPLNKVSNVYEKLMLPSRNYGLLHNIALGIAGEPLDFEEKDNEFETEAMSIRFPDTYWTKNRIAQFNREIEKVEKTIPLTDILVNVLAYGLPIFIITDGLNVEDIIMHNELSEENSLLFENHISINLREVVSEFIDGDLDRHFNSTWEKLSLQEKEVLMLIRESKAKRITIEYDSSQKPSLIIEETTQTPTRLEKQYLEQLLRKNDYERIIADGGKGELLNFVRQKKTKIKNKES